MTNTENTSTELRTQITDAIAGAVKTVKRDTPLTPSITNTITINLVANTQLAVGGSAAMVYLPEEAELMARLGGAMYVNVGGLLPVYEETLPHVARILHETETPWVLDPVAIGVGTLRTNALTAFKDYKPSVIRGNASEVIALAGLWGLAGGTEESGVRGVDATDPVMAAEPAAVALARWTGGAVAVSGTTDLVTDGCLVATSSGGSHYMSLITGAGCSLGGVITVYATAATPFVAALTGTAVYNLAGSRAETRAGGPASFQTHFVDALYNATADDIAHHPFELKES